MGIVIKRGRVEGVCITRVRQGPVCFVLSDSLKLYLVQVRAGADVRAGERVSVCGTGRKGGVRKGLILVSRLRPGCPLSAELVLCVVLVQQFDVREGKVATFAFTFTLPLAVHVYFGHLHHIAHL